MAVLGFRNLSAHPADAWISSALGEIVGFELTAPGRLQVLPAESVAHMQRELGLDKHEATAAAWPGSAAISERTSWSPARIWSPARRSASR